MRIFKRCDSCQAKTFMIKSQGTENNGLLCEKGSENMYIVKIRDWAQINKMRQSLKQQSDSQMRKYGAS